MKEKQINVWLDKRENVVVLEIPNVKVNVLGEISINNVYVEIEEDGRMTQQMCEPETTNCSDFIEIGVEELYKLLYMWLGE